VGGKTVTAQIYQAIPAILADVEAIGKTRKNQQQGYQFRGIDDVYNAIHPLLAKHKVFPTCEVLSRDTSERETKSGGALFCCAIRAKYTLWASDGSSVTTEAIGEGMDSADKASNKAMSAAYKYALFQLLCIPTEAVDGEQETPDVAPRRKAEKVAKQHGMTTADQLPAKPSIHANGLDALKRMKEVKQAALLMDWTQGEFNKGLLTELERLDLDTRLANKLPDLCKEPADFDQADQLIYALMLSGRVSDPAGTELRVKLADVKDTKLGVGA
jgi:hypothetical protein